MRNETGQQLTGKFIVLGLAAIAASPWSVIASTDAEMIERGRYIAQVGGCNDCHTSGYLLGNGEISESQWLKGDTFGWRGPWGTTYAPNLRLYVKDMSEDQWVVACRTLKRRPPMPWYTVNMMHEQDLRALYRFIVSLGAPGNPAPSYLPPDEEPPAPYALFPAPPDQK
ncbi:MAG: cytochrome C [Chromatiaceae bacterium]|nr:cytochrome C [Gammaproteobacteria bacterium]MCP5317673.1 cytochrome C [Chromatiaceae bacterium]MCW5587489.1 hypothetical protein [Chromatiales bacterium]MCP5430827.1 cytochrome C [Chromatiaceae bacterium]MCP5434855.1 cytochrome C [Chromatiaceae bacterium]